MVSFSILDELYQTGNNFPWKSKFSMTAFIFGSGLSVYGLLVSRENVPSDFATHPFMHYVLSNFLISLGVPMLFPIKMKKFGDEIALYFRIGWEENRPIEST
ncbi:hypothetical protein CEXT_750701 [Caerostris extrusa]|uniref:Uncharacterized protein n=1 Tax=Caerostris extrusa TaxID=172846 RepID=A0AAV4TIB6_CAEEX|nr:hypothetical protein CEXT_750701 [Caerostris extrusa]